MKHVPWNRYKGDEYEDGEVPEGVEAKEPEKKERGVEEDKVGVRMKEARPREFQIRKEDAEKHGYTKGCGGCSSWFRGLGRQPHTSGCREKFREAMKNEARTKLAEQKKGGVRAKS